MPDMKEALDKSGALTPSRRLYLAATKALSTHDKNAARSADAFLDVVEADPALLVEMIGKANIRGAALAYLRRRADEMGYKPTPRERRGHPDVDTLASSAPAPRLLNGEEDKGQMFSDTQPRAAAPARGPSRQELAAMVKAKEANSTSVFNRRIGGDLTLGEATKFDLMNFKRKTLIASHAADRLLTEVDWPDDHTPLRKVVGEDQVKGILESSYKMLDSLGLTNHAA